MTIYDFLINTHGLKGYKTESQYKYLGKIFLGGGDTWAC